MHGTPTPTRAHFSYSLSLLPLSFLVSLSDLPVSTLSLLKRSAAILMQRTPRSLETKLQLCYQKVSKCLCVFTSMKV
jgi:hypothetical protein